MAEFIFGVIVGIMLSFLALGAYLVVCNLFMNAYDPDDDNDTLLCEQYKKKKAHDNDN